MKIIFKMLNIKDENKLGAILKEKKGLLGIYFSAGYPYLESTEDLIGVLESNNVDFIEVGMPYSDPLADGPVIEACHAKAIANGMNMELMFSQLNRVKESNSIPLVLMGYFNPVFRFGIKKFCERCVKAGVSTLILPDLPVELYADEYHKIFNDYNIDVVFLATPDTPKERLELIDKCSRPFIYLVSSSSTTGKTQGITEEQGKRFSKFREKVRTPVMVGFGISTNKDFTTVVNSAEGAIVGSAFLKALEGVNDKKELSARASQFINSLKGN